MAPGRGYALGMRRAVGAWAYALVTVRCSLASASM